MATLKNMRKVQLGSIDTHTAEVNSLIEELYETKKLLKFMDMKEAALRVRNEYVEATILYMLRQLIDVNHFLKEIQE